MSHGIVLTNSQGRTQIDSNFISLAVYEYGVKYLGDGSGNFIVLPQWIVKQAVLLLRPASGTADGGFWVQTTLPVDGSDASYIVRALPANYEYMVLIPSHLITEPAGDWGIRVLKENGDIAYSSNFRYPRIVATAQVTGPGVRTLDFNLPPSNRKRYAYALSTGLAALAPPYYSETIYYNYIDNNTIKVQKTNSNGVHMDINPGPQIYGVFEL